MGLIGWERASRPARSLARWLAKRPKPGDLSPRDGLLCMEAVVVCREYKAALLIIVAVR